MFKKDVIAHFGNSTSTARFLGVSRMCISHWGEIIPELRARQLAELTHGKLRFVPAMYKKDPVKL